MKRPRPIPPTATAHSTLAKVPMMNCSDACGFAQFRIAGETFHCQNDGHAFRPACNDRACDSGPLEDADDAATLQRPGCCGLLACIGLSAGDPKRGGSER